MPFRCIGNSRDTSFEQLILTETNGKGVDLVLNSLAGEKLQASLRCLAFGGRFLEIGKYDISNNTPLEMSILSKEVSVFGISLDAFHDESLTNQKVDVYNMVQEGILCGAVKPLPSTVYLEDQIEQAYRWENILKYC